MLEGSDSSVCWRHTGKEKKEVVPDTRGKSEREPQIIFDIRSRVKIGSELEVRLWETAKARKQEKRIESESNRIESSRIEAQRSAAKRI